MDFPGVEFTVVYAIIAIAALVALVVYKEYRGLCTIISVITLVGAIACAINLKVQSERLFALGGIAPMGVLLIALVVNFTREYSKCTEKVSAKRMGSESQTYRVRGARVENFFPRFSYEYLGEQYNGKSILGYSYEEFGKLYSKDEDQEITVYIDPKNPIRCVDKRRFPRGAMIFLTVAGIVMILIAVIMFFVI